MLMFILAMLACGEDESEDSASEDSALMNKETEPAVRYH